MLRPASNCCPARTARSATSRHGYEGTVSGRVHHYHAPANRQVVVQVSTDGRVFREGATSSNRYFSVKYRYTKRVLVRACLYRSGASGVSFCGPWR
jgi:hypothetical protein